MLVRKAISGQQLFQSCADDSCKYNSSIDGLSACIEFQEKISAIIELVSLWRSDVLQKALDLTGLMLDCLLCSLVIGHHIGKMQARLYRPQI